MVILSKDGYVRLTLETFLSSPLVHLLSGLDDDKPPLLQEGASLARVSGYTEWVSATMPTITLGWDWRLDVSQRYLVYVKLSAPRSNVMLVDALLRDLGSTKTSALLESAIDTFAWQDEVHHYIIAKYA